MLLVSLFEKITLDYKVKCHSLQFKHDVIEHSPNQSYFQKYRIKNMFLIAELNYAESLIKKQKVYAAQCMYMESEG